MNASRIVAGLFALATLPVIAATQDIAVTAAGDITTYRYWGGGFGDRGSIPDANPNQVSHDYSWGSGTAYESSLSFDLSAVAGLTSADLTSVTLNLDILSIWTSGRDDVAGISGVGPVLASGGGGWKSFDVTTQLGQALDRHDSSVGFYLAYTGYSGMTFGSAEGGQPAFLRFSTVDVTPPVVPLAVPEPQTYAMVLAGLGVMGLLSARRRA
jgi:hypothetical protein